MLPLLEIREEEERLSLAIIAKYKNRKTTEVTTDFKFRKIKIAGVR